MTDRWSGPTLTATLLRRPDPVVIEDRAAVVDAAKRIPHLLADVAVPRLGTTSLRLTDHDVRTALASGGEADPPTPFAWSPRTARRAVGLAAVRALVAGQAKSPIDGTRAALRSATRSVREGGRSTTSMDRWLAGLPPAGLAAVEADAVTWATRLWCALDWKVFDEPPVIGRDRWWNSPHSALLALRSRAEVRSVTPSETGDPFSVHLVLLGGKRRSTVRTELSALAVAEALLAPPTIAPGRIVGWWPDSGHLVSVEIDRRAVAEGVAAITRTLARAEAVPAPSRGVARAAA